MPDIGLPPPRRRSRSVYGTLNLLQSSRQVLGADLNRSESAWGVLCLCFLPERTAHQDAPGDRCIAGFRFGPCPEWVQNSTHAAEAKGLTPTCPRSTSRPVSAAGDYLMNRLSASSECRAQALYCHVAADTATDEEVRTLWVSMAHAWMKLAEAAERLQSHQGPRGADGHSPR
jgi:hypothetical protein